MIYHGDNLEVMRSMAEESVDLIYLDPPFNTGKDWGEFDDRWRSSVTEEAWFWGLQRDQAGLYYALHTAEFTAGEGMKSYLLMLSMRLLEMKRLLKRTGSMYVHVDGRVSGYVRVVLDPFCGSGTTLVAAKRLGRRYIGIDSNARAVELSRRRVEDVSGVTEYQEELVDVTD